MLLRGWRPPLARQAPEFGWESVGRTYRDLAAVAARSSVSASR
jgi:hypothetical protein